MKMEQQVIQEIITSITPELWILFLQMFFTVLVTLVLYNVLKNVAAYIGLRLDKEMGKNVKVIYDGEVALIAYITWKHMIIKKSNGNDVLIPITKISQRDWEVVRHEGNEEES